jgi:MFS family permease
MVRTGFMLIAHTFHCSHIGNIAVAKCMLGEVTDESNQAVAFSLFGFSFGLGSLIAPTLGGLFAKPAESFPDTLGRIPLLVEYPYLLPCLISACISAIGVVLGAIYLEETNMTRRSRAAPSLEQEPLLSDSIKFSKADGLTPRQDLSSSSLAIIDDEDNTRTGPHSAQQSVTSTLSRVQVLIRASSPIAAYMILAFSQIMFQEVYVFWCNTPPVDVGPCCCVLFQDLHVKFLGRTWLGFLLRWYLHGH